MAGCFWYAQPERWLEQIAAQGFDVLPELFWIVINAAMQAERQLDDARFSLEQVIKHLDAEIDSLVYRLYGLTDEEIKIVEGKA